MFVHGYIVRTLWRSRTGSTLCNTRVRLSPSFPSRPLLRRLHPPRQGATRPPMFPIATSPPPFSVPLRHSAMARHHVLLIDPPLVLQVLPQLLLLFLRHQRLKDEQIKCSVYVSVSDLSGKHGETDLLHTFHVPAYM